MSVAVDNESRALGRVGTVLKDKWRLDALLGVGGMAAVYAATHRNAKRVAIKMLLPEFANDKEVRERFVREGYAANTIEHPGALSVLDDDISDDGFPYLVMELLEGETVEARWERAEHHVPLQEVLAMAGALLDVLAAAHAKGIVHRDIKPENLFLVRGGGLKVLDFGIARVLEATMAKQTSTRVGTVMGTPAFMAPEQALAKWDEVDGRTDLWAVGATMFTLLTGLHVHDGITGNEQLIKSATQPARSIGACIKGLPRSVIALVDRSLNFDRTKRWPDARAMQEAVRGAYEALTGGPLVIEVPAASASVVTRPPETRTASGQFRGPTSSSAGMATSGGMTTGSRPRPPPAPPAKPPPPPRRMSSGEHTAPPRRTTSGEHAAPSPIAGRVSSGGFPIAPRRTSGSFEVADPLIDPLAMSAAPNLAPPDMTALGVDAYVAGRTAERDAAAAEVARYQPVVGEIQMRLAAVRRRVASAQEQVAATRKERANEEERFRRQMNARLEGVGEARKAYRKAMGEVSKLALTDPAHFAPDFAAPERAEIEKTRASAESRARESALHEAALASFDKKALQTGLTISVGTVLLLLLLFFSPVIVRSCSSDTGTIGGSGESP